LHGGVERGAVVGGFLDDGVGQAAGRGLRAVEDVDDGLASFLAWEVGKDDGGDVGVHE
jgi:xanthine/CO dehydrogenase XdhC/CoxF family maturation factor